jgi:hypothetical protein
MIAIWYYVGDKTALDRFPLGVGVQCSAANAL